MATVKNIKLTNYCDDVNNELVGMKSRIDALREDVKKAYGAESPVTHEHERHLCELSDMIEWKLQILMKVCPFDWKGAEQDFEDTVSVGPDKSLETSEFSGGYIGG
jgi:hypothetical protein